MKKKRDHGNKDGNNSDNNICQCFDMLNQITKTICFAGLFYSESFFKLNVVGFLLKYRDIIYIFYAHFNITEGKRTYTTSVLVLLHWFGCLAAQYNYAMGSGV